jgi:hypothetical protein
MTSLGVEPAFSDHEWSQSTRKPTALFANFSLKLPSQNKQKVTTDYISWKQKTQVTISTKHGHTN